METKTKKYLKYGGLAIGSIAIIIIGYYGIKKILKKSNITNNEEKSVADLKNALIAKGETSAQAEGIVKLAKKKLTKPEIERLTTIINTIIYAKTHKDEYEGTEMLAFEKELEEIFNKLKK